MNQQTLLLRLPEGEGDAQFVLRDAAGAIREAGQDSLAALAERARGQAVVALTPGPEVLLTRARVPARNPRALARALPYALEDQLAGDVDTLHCVPGARLPDDNISVAVVSRAQMDQWREQLREAGLDPRSLVPETALLPTHGEGWLLWLEHDSAWLSTGPGEGMALDRDNAALLVRLRLEETDEEARPGHLEVLRHGPARDTDQGLAELDGLTLKWRDSEATLLEEIARQLPAKLPFNLLTGPYSRREQLGRLWRPWRAAAAVLAAWALIQVALVVVDIQRLERERAALDAQMREIYETAVPGSRAGGDPRRQMESALAGRGREAGAAGAGDLGETLAHTATVLTRLSGVSIQSLRYRPGQMELDLQLDSLQSLDRLKQELEADAAWAVEIQSASARDDGVESRIQIRRVGS